MNIKNLLEIRARLKSKKPVFLMQDYHKRKELPAKWRKPAGKQSKLRLGKKGHRKKPSQGFRSPKLVRGLHRSGLKMVRVCSLKELEALPKDVGVVVSSNLGQKKRIEIVKRAEELKLKILNIKSGEFLKRIEEKKEKKVEKKEEKLEKKEEKKKVGKIGKKEGKEREKKVEKEEKRKEEEIKEERKGEEIEEKGKEEKKEEQIEEERKEAEKRGKDKLLTKRVR